MSKHGTLDEPPKWAGIPAQLAALRRLDQPEAHSDGDCWEWPGPRNAKGYGVVASSLAGGSSRLAHRVAWVRAKSSLARGDLVCHKCDNPPCIRPSHLFVGSHKDNSQDMVTKGRSVQNRNEGSSRAILTDAQVAEIRSRVSRGETRQSVADAFQISATHVCNICNFKRRPT